jgi:hypothetical protein
MRVLIPSFPLLYKEMRSKFSVSTKDKSLFLSLAESIAQILNVTLYYVCGKTNMGDHWPWEARKLDPQELFNKTAFPKHKRDIWLLQTSVIENYCLSHPEDQFSTPVGDLTCLEPKFYNDTAQGTQWWRSPNHIEPHSHPLTNFPNPQKT